MPAAIEFSTLRRALAVDPAQSQPLVWGPPRPPELGEPAFWSRWANPELDALARQLASAPARAGRVVAISDPSSSAAARQWVAVQLAHRLSAPGSKVLLVDAQIDGGGFSRGFSDPESEGLVDLILYGSSLSVTSQTAPMAGVSLLGAGSFLPAAADAFESQALERALRQARAEFAWVLIAVPALRAPGRHHEILAHVDGVLVAARAAEASDAAVGELVGYLSRLRIPLWGAVLFGAPTASPPPTPVGAAKGETSASSPIFRWSVAATALTLLGFVGWWTMAQRRQPEPPPVQVLSSTLPTPPGVAEITAETLLEPSFAPAEPAVSRSNPESVAVDVGPPTPRAENAEIAAEAPSVVEKQAEAATVGRPAEAEIERALSLQPGAGWALHLWSFPDSMEAVQSLRALKSEGLLPRVVGVDLPDKGRWYRVVVGRFEHQADALSARGLMASWPGVENVGIVRVP